MLFLNISLKLLTVLLLICLVSSAEARLLPFLSQDAYRVRIEGEVAPEIKNLLLAVSETHALKDRPVATPEMLRRRAANDIAPMTRALRSEGFYKSDISAEMKTGGEIPEVIFHVKTGPAYLIHEILITSEDTEPSVQHLPKAKDLNLVPGTRARAPEILKGVDLLKNFFRERGTATPEVTLKTPVVRHSDHSVHLHYTYKSEPISLFGDLSVEGTKRVKPLYVENRVPWRKGELFRASHLNRFRSQLMQDGLFAMVDIHHPPLPDGDLFLPVHVSLIERSPRTIKAGVFHEPDTGSGVKVDWEHRNLRGMGERLNQSFTLAERKKESRTEYRIPDFMDKRQSLRLSGWVGEEESQAYKSEEGAFGARIFRQLCPLWSASTGVQYRLSRTTQQKETKTFGLISFPQELIRDQRNSILNPTKGMRMFWRIEPLRDTLDTDVWFLKLSTGMSVHFPLIAEEKLVFSMRGTLGSILGESNLSVPADERFYAGGGGSIRGYSYKSIGPEEKGTVVGGRSMVETGGELRWRMENNFGLVAFLDGGQVFTSSELQLEDDFYWGAGLGLRYYTDFAPFRLDVAFPLNRRARDDSFQIYISIGQAF
ncbi:autotransporter secretion outer membrane protein TamA [Desulfobotulus alkaliphilus]|uniref:Autotransporter secretion outer membrane protein TamA n=1 Tax=Desulfobotulus alkaliphilus TaxID=622671 RepID=A0A562RFX3_9BACT|nr:BamA/TamA family outer membrane protein [Desulfobotulus alkaliphilus]TWI67783.1 autotransporter secretion outer membrane protein TamA [Desulfobotulus alkaliphilus]